MRLEELSPYGQGLNKIAPPGMKPKGVRIDRWHGWKAGTAEREVEIKEESKAG